MLALPERVAEPRPDQVLSHAELVALSTWKLNYNAESAALNMGADDVRATASRLKFVWYLRQTGLIGS